MQKLYRNKNLYLYIMSFLLPFILICLIFAVLHVYPFGNSLFLVHDLSGQYISFLTYLRDMAGNKNDFFYSFSQVFGLDVVGVICYYLLSPFNILVFLINNTELAVTLIIMLKIAASGLTFFTFLSAKFKPSITNLIFSSMYALCAYNIVYSHNLMWLDGVILLPIITLDIEILFKKERPWIYLISLTVGILANYYIGYMLCLFSLLYFIAKLIMRYENIKALKKVIIKFAASSLCAGLANAVVILPTISSLSGGKTGIGINDYGEFGLDILLSKFCTGSYDLGQLHFGANIYCSVAAVVLLITYFFNKKIILREKIFSGTAIVLLFISLMSPLFQSVWHIFTKTEGFPARHAFVVCFVMVYLAYRSFVNRDGIPRYAVFAAFGVCFLACVFLLTKEFEYLPKGMIILSAVFALITSLILLVNRENIRRYAAIGLALTVFADLSVNTYKTFSQFEFCNADEYYQYSDTVSGAVEAVKTYDSGFYRMEKTFSRTFVNRKWLEPDRNEPMRFGYNGLTSFNSGQKQFVKDFCKNIGFTTYHQWSSYREGTTRAVDILFGIKYILDNENRFDNLYNTLTVNDGITVYQNPFALSVAFAADEAIDSCDLTGLNAFEIQNKIFKTILGYGDDILTPQEYSINAVNMTLQSDGKTWLIDDNNAEAYLEFKLTAKDGNPLYAFFPSDEIQRADIAINGESDGAYFDYFRHDIINLGGHSAGDEIVIRINPHEENLCFDSALFYSENLEYLAAYAQTIGTGNVSLEKISSSHLTGTVAVPDGQERLMFTVPYQDGWNMYIDGEKVDYTAAFGTFISIPVTAGEHEIEFKYIPKNFGIGLTITILSVMFALIAAFYKPIKKKINSWR